MICFRCLFNTNSDKAGIRSLGRVKEKLSWGFKQKIFKQMNKRLSSFLYIMPSLLHKSQDVKEWKFSAHCRLFGVVYQR